MKKYICAGLFLFLILPGIYAELDPDDYRLVTLLNEISLDQEFKLNFLLNQNKEDLTVMLNACFARHGRPFSSRRVRDIFQNTKWYKVDPYYSDKMLTAIDKKNIITIRSLLLLSSENTTLLYQIKRIDKYLSLPSPNDDHGVQIDIDKARDGFALSGKIIGPMATSPLEDSPGPAENEYKFKKFISFDEYGPQTWFIYNDKFYFLIAEDVEINGYLSWRVRIYLSCRIDYRKKLITELEILNVTTTDF